MWDAAVAVYVWRCPCLNESTTMEQALLSDCIPRCLSSHPAVSHMSFYDVLEMADIGGPQDQDEIRTTMVAYGTDEDACPQWDSWIQATGTFCIVPRIIVLSCSEVLQRLRANSCVAALIGGSLHVRDLSGNPRTDMPWPIGIRNHEKSG